MTLPNTSKLSLVSDKNLTVEEKIWFASFSSDSFMSGLSSRIMSNVTGTALFQMERIVLWPSHL
jgi:hypothetical protein